METKSLHDALTDREGVQEIVIAPHETFSIMTEQGKYEFTGPARVLVNQD
ncbi:BC1881 family protein [Lysinibacillus xylanilyticus]